MADQLIAIGNKEAALEILYAIRDVNRIFFMEKLPVVKEKGLAVTFEKLRNDKNISAHLIQDVRKELPNTLAWKKMVFAQVLHAIKDQLLVKKQLTLRGVSSDVIETVKKT